jgi:DNA (cytosine-5)-methyltransferase 3A
MKILSLFDGISCARVAIERLGIKIEKYYASEIDKYAIQIAQKNYPDTIQVGDITKLKGEDFKDIDLMIGGSPCQDLSIAKKDRQGLKGARSGLFFEYVRLLKEVEPKYFILENVNSMPKEARIQITEIMGVEPIMINASLVSAQNRKRLFWTNIPGVTQPEDLGILLKYILQDANTEDLKSYAIDANYFKGANWKQYKEKGRRQLVVATLDEGTWAKRYEQIRRVYGVEGISPTLPTGTGGGVIPKIFIPTNTKLGYDIAKNREDGIRLQFQNSKTARGRVIKGKAQTLQTSLNAGVLDNSMIRKLTPIECERLQCLPDNYTEGVSNTQRYKALGNAFNVEVVRHILSFLKVKDIKY